MFEVYQFRKLMTVNKAIAPIYSVGGGTGLILNVSGGLTTVAPVINNVCPRDSIQVNRFAGLQLNSHTRALLERDSIDIGSTTAQLEIVREIKEKVAVVASKSSCIGSVEDVKYELPDEVELTISGKTRAQILEPLFSKNKDVPDLMMYAAKTVQEVVQAALSKVKNASDRQQLLKNVVLCGGTTDCVGFEERIKFELEKALGEEVVITAQPERNFTVIKGLQQMATM